MQILVIELGMFNLCTYMKEHLIELDEFYLQVKSQNIGVYQFQNFLISF